MLEKEIKSKKRVREFFYMSNTRGLPFLRAPAEASPERPPGVRHVQVRALLWFLNCFIHSSVLLSKACMKEVRIGLEDQRRVHTSSTFSAGL